MNNSMDLTTYIKTLTIEMKENNIKTMEVELLLDSSGGVSEIGMNKVKFTIDANNE